MRGVAELGSLVHRPRAHLEFEQRAVRANHRGVQGLVPARLGLGDVIVVLSGYRTVQLVNRLEERVTRHHLLLSARSVTTLA